MKSWPRAVTIYFICMKMKRLSFFFGTAAFTIHRKLIYSSNNRFFLFISLNMDCVALMLKICLSPHESCWLKVHRLFSFQREMNQFLWQNSMFKRIMWICVSVLKPLKERALLLFLMVYKWRYEAVRKMIFALCDDIPIFSKRINKFQKTERLQTGWYMWIRHFKLF